jgi:hypothetical protein
MVAVMPRFPRLLATVKFLAPLLLLLLLWEVLVRRTAQRSASFTETQ